MIANSCNIKKTLKVDCANKVGNFKVTHRKGNIDKHFYAESSLISSIMNTEWPKITQQL